ncbi:metallophosphoesterase [Paenibacillus filicis]|uniref:Metallophosphoesterase n=1 Tax=Paenibacillus gyeongsangnamensis TaxID=3388067 RepID=A0ABT4QGY9_9BACL|nr:metallophosphoesterase [Paenibacillus filicis]MCZ8516143.1 metallophosphoesterase [Paenibacillus filicis]
MGRFFDIKKIVDYFDLVTKLTWACIRGNTTRATELFNELRMYDYDPRWSEVIEEYLLFKEQGDTIPYVRYKDLSDFVIPIENKLKIAFISDWGTGAKDAESLLLQVMSHEPEMLIHLGDIYYAGTMDEVQNNFYNIIEKNVNLEQTKVYNLSGNHDMYSGGKGYYWLLKHLKQQASYFCLRNDYWQFLAMDTGLNDNNPFTTHLKLTYLDPAEVVWHLDKFKTAGTRKTVLLSHHQFFSDGGVGMDEHGRKVAFNPHLNTAFHKVLDQVELWLWGHEHNLIVFDEYINLQRGRCIGASAFPVMAHKLPYPTKADLNLQGLNAWLTINNQVMLRTNNDGFYNHAYVIMTLEDANARVDYYQVDSIDNGDSELLYYDEIRS